MGKLKRFLWIPMFLLVPLSLFCQTRQVTGRVTDQVNKPVPRASILVKGTTTGTSADENGRFTIMVPSSNSVLIVSSAGFTSQELQLGSANEYAISLGTSAELSEVIVTAFGIKKEKKSLGYTAQSVSGEDLNVNRQGNVVNALQGKVAGVTITSTGGAPGQGARIRIRGINSLDAGRNNQPLFILDGVEIDNSTFETGGGETRGMTNRAADINPDDIESISVLRGGAATALYGIRAANGAIVITTKSAKGGKVQLSYTGTYGFEKVNKTPDVQSKFTQGFLGTVSRKPDYDPTSFWPSWGPTIAEGKSLDPTHPDAIYNNFEQGYRTGNQTRHSISLMGG
ncbi:MAG TPA: TonB-dependent receptor plug domain-containing protein, partial [Flavitalea sp.]|nr:TonB-dependent receptor plug domain-containing protein [Flavitalea sp.]